ncbi:PTS fructose transporter subunit IIC [Sporolactobacillus terrae]|uniref:PTS fructose transporter subunit IIC n=1 Tax=Sporolactobacillus terrae TaxID=269673 RepID=UPI001119FA75|nr:fructose-specific PTS transporter subunit EIIC [Sporolactobacillus terrae]
MVNGEPREQNRFPHELYDSLMNGIRHMIPFVVGGGILMAVSFMFGVNAADVKDPSYNPIAALLYAIGHGNGFALMVPILAGFIAYGISGTLALAPGMIGGLIAASTGSGFFGGILAGYLSGYFIRLLNQLCRKFPKGLVNLRNVLLYPVVSVLFTGVVMYEVVAYPMSVFNNWLVACLSSFQGSSLEILGLILGAMMAVDLGGPINKAAYTFGLAMISAGNYYPMAAIMAGGLVPPIGIGLATVLFKKKFDAEDRDQGKTYFLLGASFITESAMPVAAKDVFRIIPSSIVGSAIAGAMTMAFHVALPAPHGGVFVLPVVQGGLTQQMLYLLSILTGVVVTALMIGLLRKNITEKQSDAQKEDEPSPLPAALKG